MKLFYKCLSGKNSWIIQDNYTFQDYWKAYALIPAWEPTYKMKLIPQDFATEYVLIPVDKLGSSLSIAMASPLNNEVVKKIREITGLQVRVFVSTPSDIRRAIEKYYKK